MRRCNIKRNAWPGLLILFLSIASLFLGASRLEARGKAFWIEGRQYQNNNEVIRLNTFVKLATKLKPSVVNISVTKVLTKHPSVPPGFLNPFKEKDPGEKFFGKKMPKEFPSESSGSGFIINKKGFIITNQHVVKDTDKILIRLSNGKEFQAEVVGEDPKTDLALLKVDTGEDLPVAVLGDSDGLQIGEWVIAIGNPFGFEHSITAGIVSAKGRFLGSSPYDDFIQTDAPINPGNSGGPLFNLHGQVVGINTAVITGGQGLGFAIPINLAKDILPQLKDKGKYTRGWLGVSISNLTEELAEEHGLDSPHGVYVSSVMKDNPADKAGIKDGDIIINFDGTEINDVRELQKIVASTDSDIEVKVTLIRKGIKKTLKVKVGEMPDRSFAEVRDLEKNLGLTLADITPRVAENLKLDDTKGVLVAEVEPESPAERAGLLNGDIIREVNKTQVGTLHELRKVLQENQKELILFLVERENEGRYLVLKR
jgi:serine protease Do